MFSFDEELFKEAYENIVSSLDCFNLIDTSEKTLSRNLIPNNFNYYYNDYLTCVEESKKEISELEKDMEATRAIINLMNSGVYCNGVDANVLLLFQRILDSNLTGANQGGPQILYNLGQEDYDSLPDYGKEYYSYLLQVIEKHKVLLSVGYWNDGLDKFINASNMGGCGFAANTNIIIDYYVNLENGEELFQQKYGYPLYVLDSDGVKHYNYTVLMLDHFFNSVGYYCTHIPGTDTRIPDWWPKFNPSFINYCFSNGTMAAQRERFLENELKNADVKSTTYSVDPKNLHSEELKQHNYAVVNAIGHFTLRDMEGKTYSYSANHFLEIAGVMPDGRYIVYSWGELYVLDSFDRGQLYLIDID